MEIGQSTVGGKENVNTEDGHLSPFAEKKRTWRSYILHNNYVPLVSPPLHISAKDFNDVFQVSRIVNITFTTVTLAFAVRIREVESSNHIRGAVGSSP
jgi:hypothetical protein